MVILPFLTSEAYNRWSVVNSKTLHRKSSSRSIGWGLLRSPSYHSSWNNGTFTQNDCHMMKNLTFDDLWWLDGHTLGLGPILPNAVNAHSRHLVTFTDITKKANTYSRHLAYSRRSWDYMNRIACNTFHIYYQFVAPKLRPVLPNPIYGIGKIGPWSGTSPKSLWCQALVFWEFSHLYKLLQVIFIGKVLVWIFVNWQLFTLSNLVVIM